MFGNHVSDTLLKNGHDLLHLDDLPYIGLRYAVLKSVNCDNQYFFVRDQLESWLELCLLTIVMRNSQ